MSFIIGSVRPREYLIVSSFLVSASLTCNSVPPAKPVPPEDVARTILFLASQRFSGSVHGQLIPIDAGKTGNLVWTKEELAERPRTSDRS